MEKRLSIEEMLTLAEKVENWARLSMGEVARSDMSVGYGGSVEELGVEVCWSSGIFKNKYQISVVNDGVVIGCNYCVGSEKVKSIYESAERIYEERLKQTKKEGIERAIELATN